MSGNIKDSDDNDIKSWNEEIQQAKPLKKKGRAIAEPPKNKTTPKENAEKKRKALIARQLNSDNATVSENYKTLELGDVSAVDRNTADKVKRGQFPIDTTLDLHGMTLENASVSLYQLIRNSYDAGDRCLLVITGKGVRSEHGRGVIRENISKWLNADGIRNKILLFTHAQPQHGGSGAVYILLKRKR